MNALIVIIGIAILTAIFAYNCFLMDSVMGILSAIMFIAAGFGLVAHILHFAEKRDREEKTNYLDGHYVCLDNNKSFGLPYQRSKR